MKKTLRKFLPKVIGLKLSSLFLIRPNSALNKAFILFCSPRRGRVKPEQKAFLTTAKREKIKIDHCLVQSYHWKGEKETILLVHGWESNTHRWQQLIEKLQEVGYNVVAFDAPAHGDSSGKLFNIPLYSKYMTAFVEKHRPDYIIAHSIGAMTTMYQQHGHPEKSEKIILLGSPADMGFIIDGFQNILRLSPRFMEALKAYFIKEVGHDIKDFSIQNFTAINQQKGLLIHDVYDKIVPYSAAKTIHENWENSNLITTEGAGHSLDNNAIHADILHFLKD